MKPSVKKLDVDKRVLDYQKHLFVNGYRKSDAGYQSAKYGLQTENYNIFYKAITSFGKSNQIHKPGIPFTSSGGPPKFEIVMKNCVIDKYKLAKYITNMPAGKRKYILMHKQAYDNYKKIKAIPYINRHFTQQNQMIKLRKIMASLKIRINE